MSHAGEEAMAMPPKKTQREYALRVVHQLREAGHEAMWAGGCVRDQLLGLQPKDYDVATSARPEQVRQLFGLRRTLAIGAAFGVIAIRCGGSYLIEVATFRTDGVYRDGRRPESVEFSNAEHDAQRRDFTINGLFYDPLAEQVVDYVGGVADLEAGVVRAIGEPRHRFNEDKLRMLRAVRFAATFDFHLEPSTLAAIQQMAGEINQVSCERIGSELRRILTHESRARGVLLLAESGLVEPLLPELAPYARASDPRWAAAVERLARLRQPTFPAAMAALVFDMVDRASAAALGRRIRLTNKEIDRLGWLQDNLGLMTRAAELPWPVLQRVLIHSGVDELLAVSETILPHDDPGLSRCREVLARPSSQWNPPPLVTGDDLKHAGLNAGRHFAELLEHLRDLQLEGRLRTLDEAVEEARRWVAQRALPAQGR